MHFVIGCMILCLAIMFLAPKRRLELGFGTVLLLVAILLIIEHFFTAFL